MNLPKSLQKPLGVELNCPIWDEPSTGTARVVSPRRWHLRASLGTWLCQGHLASSGFIPAQGLGQAQLHVLNWTKRQIKRSWCGFCWIFFSPVFFSPCPHKSGAGTQRWQWLSPALLYHINNKWLNSLADPVLDRNLLCSGAMQLLLLLGNLPPFSRKNSIYIEFEEILCISYPAPPAINCCIPWRFMKDDLSEKRMSLPMTDWPSTYDHDPKPDEPFEEIFWMELGNGSVIETGSVGLFSTQGGQCQGWGTFVHCFVFCTELNSWFLSCKTRCEELPRLQWS